MSTDDARPLPASPLSFRFLIHDRLLEPDDPTFFFSDPGIAADIGVKIGVPSLASGPHRSLKKMKKVRWQLCELYTKIVASLQATCMPKCWENRGIGIRIGLRQRML